MANPWKASAVEAISSHLRDCGPVEWERVASKFPDVPKATLWRWIKEVRAKASDSPSRQKLQAAKKKIRDVVDEVRTAGGSLPAMPSPAYIAAAGAEGLDTLRYMGCIHQLYEDALLLRAYALNADGKIRIPAFFERSIRLRRDILQTGLDAQQEVYDLQKMQEMQNAIIEAVGEASPEIQKKVIDRLRRLDRERGITVN